MSSHGDTRHEQGEHKAAVGIYPPYAQTNASRWFLLMGARVLIEVCRMGNANTLVGADRTFVKSRRVAKLLSVSTDTLRVSD